MTSPDIFKLVGKNALITGGASGLGEAISKGLSNFGATVVIADADYGKALNVADEINHANQKAYAVKVDVLSKKSVVSMVDKAIELMGSIDILVNSAGTNRRKELLAVEEEDWDLVVGVNLKGTFLCTQAVGNHMIMQKSGRIINLSSILETVALSNQCCYASSKGGVSQFTKVAALEWAEYNITVNSIGPSYIETPLVKAVMNDPDRYRMLSQRNPMKRFGKPEEVVGLAVFLASEASSFVTGQTIFVDGGWTSC